MSTREHFIDFPIFMVPELRHHVDKGRGENQKGILILIEFNEDTEVLVSFLAKILSAAKIELEKDVLLLPIALKKNVSLISIIRENNIATVLNFGIPFGQMGLHIQQALNQPIAFKNCRFLLTHSLQAIHEERQAGGKQMAGGLWQALKELFL